MTPETNLYRQVNPEFVKDGRILSLAFKPMPKKDNGLLSVYDGDRCSAQTSYEHFTVQLGCQSLGALAVTVQECEEEALRVLPDYAEHEYHALIDFSGKTPGEVKRAAKRLTDLAMGRGWAYRPQG